MADPNDVTSQVVGTKTAGADPATPSPGPSVVTTGTASPGTSGSNGAAGASATATAGTAATPTTDGPTVIDRLNADELENSTQDAQIKALTGKVNDLTDALNALSAKVNTPAGNTGINFGDRINRICKRIWGDENAC